ncbi:uncharacterized protein LOC130825876 [Amaranthus tricolor]|uniref:uncharacterized protein LOC130825876 n=1 Tax=Amaranthus tricolor TaxID=29722 RepID=UPI00258CA72B|nr:uncharacterized protein LOC130825876 [Amaranthus tricolor]XP_057547309.1 uncharacterized protein LOC130825876 [Amaranthus tricolor]
MANYSNEGEHYLSSQEIDESSSNDKKYGGLVPKKKPLISKDHERAFFDSADWALCKQGAMNQKTTVAVESLRPKLQRTPHQQLPPRRPAYTSG